MRSLIKIGVLVTIVAVSACESNYSPVAPTVAVFTPVPVPAPAPAPVPVSGTLVVESFSVVAYPYSFMPERWFYSPLIRVRAPEGSVTVTEVVFAIPGVVGAPRLCSRMPVDSRQGRDLFREIYGDYELSFSGSGLHAPGDLARVTITYVDDTGAVAVTTAEGPVVAGGLPTTYTGGSSEWITCR